MHQCKPVGDSNDFYFCPGPGEGYTKYTSNVWQASVWKCELLPSEAHPSNKTNQAEFRRSQATGTEAHTGYADIARGAAQRGMGVALIMALVAAFSIVVFFSRKFWRTRLGAINNAAYEAAAAELDSIARDAGLWARHYATSKGDEHKARAAYIRDRARIIHRESVS